MCKYCGYGKLQPFNSKTKQCSNCGAFVEKGKKKPVGFGGYGS